MKKFNFKLFVTSVLIPLIVGGISTLIVKDNLGIYSSINKPSFSPPSIVFGIVWPILYFLMGISLYLVLHNQKTNNEHIVIFFLQLIFNFVWPILFFNYQLFWLAFVWLLVLIYLVIRMITVFWKINKTAALLQIPYLIWIAFASILNLVIAVLN